MQNYKNKLLNKRLLFKIFLLLPFGLFHVNADADTKATVNALPSPTIDNPIVLQRADPWIYKDSNTGCYFFIGTAPEFDRIELLHACRLNDLKLAPPKVIWRKKSSGPMSVNIWAPELHFIDDTWYIYFAAGDVAAPFSIRMYVLANSNEDPLSDHWREEGQIKTHLDTFSLDATTFSHRGKRYLIWAQMDAEHSYNSALWIAEMASPTSIKKPIVQLSKPDLAWETLGYKVNEGAAVIARHNKIFITYSASATDDRYAMGLLWADANADLLDANSWHKSPEPIFATDSHLGRYGPGHNSFTLAEDGTTDLMIYHARDYQEIQGTPLTDPNRHARARVLLWNKNGFPDFQATLAD